MANLEHPSPLGSEGHMQMIRYSLQATDPRFATLTVLELSHGDPTAWATVVTGRNMLKVGTTPHFPPHALLCNSFVGFKTAKVYQHVDCASGIPQDTEKN
jgi:hypothetical protein